jgi:tetratricopeptide (TPR) repeat protein
MIELRKAHELDVVELTEDLPEYGVRQGARGTVVEVFDQPEEAYMVEFLENSGEVSKIADWVKPDQFKNIDLLAKELYWKGMKALESGNFVEAIRNIRKAVKLIPSYIGGMHNSLGQSIGPHEDWLKFITAMHLIRLVDPQYGMARENLAIAYLNHGVQEAKDGKYQESLTAFHYALSVEASLEVVQLIKQNIAASYTALGNDAFRRDDMETFLSLFRSAHSTAATETTRLNLAKAEFHYANFCANTGNPVNAVASYQRAEDGGLMWPEVLNNHGCALARVGRFDDAIMVFEAAQALAPEDQTIDSNLSTLLSRQSIASREILPDLSTQDIEIDFITPQMNTIPLHVTA